MAEWLKAHAWNACIGESLSRVRIPLSPPQAPELVRIFSQRAKHPSCRAEYAELRKRLTGYGYRLYTTWEDCTAAQPALTSRWRYLSTMMKVG